MGYLIIRTNSVVARHELPDEGVTIGRSRECGIAIDESQASRKHCRIERDAGRWVLCDLASTNGTRVNGALVSRHELRDGEEVQIGLTRLSFCASAGGAAGEPDEDHFCQWLMATIPSSTSDDELDDAFTRPTWVAQASDPPLAVAASAATTQPAPLADACATPATPSRQPWNTNLWSIASDPEIAASTQKKPATRPEVRDDDQEPSWRKRLTVGFASVAIVLCGWQLASTFGMFSGGLSPEVIANDIQVQEPGD